MIKIDLMTFLGVVEIILMSETFLHTCSLGLDRIMKRRVRMGSRVHEIFGHVRRTVFLGDFAW